MPKLRSSHPSNTATFAEFKSGITDIKDEKYIFEIARNEFVKKYGVITPPRFKAFTVKPLMTERIQGDAQKDDFGSEPIETVYRPFLIKLRWWLSISSERRLKCKLANRLSRIKLITPTFWVNTLVQHSILIQVNRTHFTVTKNNKTKT